MVVWVVLAAVICFLVRNLRVAQGIMCIVIGLFGVVMGLRCIVTRRPFLISSRWHTTLLLLFWIPWFVQLFPVRDARLTPDFVILLIGVGCYAIFLGFAMWKGLRGYSAYGVTRATFRDGLRAALKKLEVQHEANWSNLSLRQRLSAALKELDPPPEERAADLRLPSIIRLSPLGAELHVSVRSWMGIGHVQIEPRKFAPKLEDIVGEMSTYYRSANVRASMACVWTLLTWAAIMIAGTGWLLAWQAGNL
jgi:hypothetical protein